MKLTFKDGVTTNGNNVRQAALKAELVTLSPVTFSYNNANGEVINYKLASVKFTDNKGDLYKKGNVCVYEASFSKGMEIGETYLGKLAIALDENLLPAKDRKPWVTLSSYEAYSDFSIEEFEFEDVEEPISL
jgi:hypothetical protein